MKQLAGFKEWLTWQKAAPYCGNRTGPPRGGRPDRIFGRNFLPTSLSLSLFISLVAWLNLNLRTSGQIGQIPETALFKLYFNHSSHFVSFN